MKKLSGILAVLLASTMLLSACGGNKTGSTTSTTGAKEEAYTVKYAFLMLSAQPEMQMVVDEISKVSEKKINVKFEGLPLNSSAFNQQINLMLSGGEKLDLMYQQGSLLSSNASMNRLVDMGPQLDKNGPDIKKYLDKYLKVGQINGKQYAVPAIRNMGNAYGVAMREDILKKYNIDYTKIKTYEDLEAVYTKVAAGEPEMKMVMGQSGVATIYDQLFGKYDGLVDSFGALMDLDSLKVTNKYEDPGYVKDVKRIRTWYEKGWVPKDIATMPDAAPALVKSGKLFSFASNIKPGYEQQSSGQSGTQMRVAEIIPIYALSSAVSSTSLAIPVTCKNVPKTVQFLNLMYGDPEIINLFDWGIEGKHYVKTNDGVITFPEGKDAKSSGYYPNLGWQHGNQLLSHVWKGDDPKLWTILKAWNASAKFSKAFGFTWDSSAVKTEYTALLNVENQYKTAIQNGAVNPDTELPKFNAALKAAGLEKYMAAKQKQLDDWAAANNVK